MTVTKAIGGGCECRQLPFWVKKVVKADEDCEGEEGTAQGV